MRCEKVVERLLEADPAELRGEGDGALVRHLGRCRRCARVAAKLVAELGAVDEALEAYGRAGDPAAAADRALAAVRGERPPVAGGRSRTGVRGRSAWPRDSWRRRAWVPLAAAAALAAVLLVGREAGPPEGSPPASGPESPARVAVVPPPDRGVAVLETANPKITIIWLYEREES